MKSVTYVPERVLPMYPVYTRRGHRGGSIDVAVRVLFKNVKIVNPLWFTPSPLNKSRG